MLDHLISEYHLHPIVDHFTIALLAVGIAAEFLAAAATILSRGGTGWLCAWSQKLRSTSLLLMIGGAIAAVLSYFTGDIEADRLWDTMSPGRTADPGIHGWSRAVSVARGSRTVPDVRIPDSCTMASAYRILARGLSAGELRS